MFAINILIKSNARWGLFHLYPLLVATVALCQPESLYSLSLQLWRTNINRSFCTFNDSQLGACSDFPVMYRQTSVSDIYKIVAYKDSTILILNSIHFYGNACVKRALVQFPPIQRSVEPH